MQKSINDLILFCLLSIEEKGDEAVFQRLVKECFSRFPKRFALTGFPKWPDTRKLDSRLRKLRARKLLKGSPQTFFHLTTSGKKVAQDITKVFRQKKLL